MENLWNDFINFIRQKGVVVPEARQVGDIIQREVVVPSAKIPIYETISYPFKNQQVTGAGFEIINGTFRGVISELLIYAQNTDPNNKNFSVSIIADGNAIYQDTFDNFSLRSDYSTDMTCFNDEINDNYVSQFNSIAFDRSIFVRIYGITTPITFTLIYAKVLRITLI